MDFEILGFSDFVDWSVAGGSVLRVFCVSRFAGSGDSPEFSSPGLLDFRTSYVCAFANFWIWGFFRLLVHLASRICEVWLLAGLAAPIRKIVFSNFRLPSSLLCGVGL